MTSSATTAALIHRRIARLQALIRGQQCRKRVVLLMRDDYDTLRQRVNREAFGQDEPPYEELADLGFFESADEWKGAPRRPPQLLPQSPPQVSRDGGDDNAAPLCASSTEPTTEAAAGAETGEVSVFRATDDGAGGEVCRPKEEVLADLKRVRRAIKERIEALRLQQQKQRVGSLGPPE